MASITKIGRRWRALVRKGGTARCATFGTRQLASSWPATIEGQIDQLKASGFLKATDLTVADLISRYQRELYPFKQWSPSKTRNLRTLAKAFGADLVTNLDRFRIVEVFTDMHAKGAGGVGVGSRMSYLQDVQSKRDNRAVNAPSTAHRADGQIAPRHKLAGTKTQRELAPEDIEMATQSKVFIAQTQRRLREAGLFPANAGKNRASNSNF
jgi:hypothetical protein